MMYLDMKRTVADIVRCFGSAHDLVIIKGNCDAHQWQVDLDPPFFAASKESNSESEGDSHKSRKQLRVIEVGADGRSLTELLSDTSHFKGPVVVDAVLESAPEPFEAIRSIAKKLINNGYIILTSEFNPPSETLPHDRWRFTPDGLGQLLSNANLYVLESGWCSSSSANEEISADNPDASAVPTAYAVAALNDIPRDSNHTTSLVKADSTAGDDLIVTSGRYSQPGLHPGKYRCVFLNTCYDAFLNYHYRANPKLLLASYNQQLSALNKTFFGDSDFYSSGLRACGFDAIDLVVNCEPLQKAWAFEHSIGAAGWDLVTRQLEQLKPDVVYVQDMAGTPKELLASARAMGALIVGQIACELAHSVPLNSYDIVFSSFPHFVDAFRQAGLTSYYQPLAFDPRIREELGNVPYSERDIEFSFIGGISSFHRSGSQLLERLASETPLQIWGYGIEQIPPISALVKRHRGEAWGKDLFSLFGRSRITLNRHSEAAGTNANNMRLFEATGSGALLITDYKDNLNQLFEIGEEVVAYRNPDECVALVRYYLEHPKEARRIAEAGQRRTLNEHSYNSRMVKTAEILSRHLKYRKLTIPAPDIQGVSSGLRQLPDRNVRSELLEAWKDARIASSQRGLVQQQLMSMYRGSVPEPFSVANRLLSPIVKRGSSILEVGCSSGYYYEVLEYLLNKPLCYTGCDYSSAMIEMAKEFYPGASFAVADGAALPFASRHFDIVISGCVLLHCPNYSEHIKESCRVARDYILLHRTPISTSGGTRIFEKLAYGVPTVELWFAENELLKLFEANGFECFDRIQYAHDKAQHVSTISYILKAKVPA